MSAKDQGARKPGRRAFQPGGSMILEPRVLLSQAQVTIESVTHVPSVTGRTGLGGGRIILRDTDLELYSLNLTGGGTIRAKPMSGGRVKILLYGTTTQSVLEIDPIIRGHSKNSAHFKKTAPITQDGLLHVGEIYVQTGEMYQILAYHTADLSGPVVLAATTPVDRIAFEALLPGAQIVTGGDVNTLDVATNADLDGTDSKIDIGRDLNLLNVGQDLTLSDGGTVSVGRSIGAQAQSAKGSDTGTDVLTTQNTITGQISFPVGGYIEGNLVINAGSTFTVPTVFAQVRVIGNIEVGTLADDRIVAPLFSQQQITQTVVGPDGTTNIEVLETPLSFAAEVSDSRFGGSPSTDIFLPYPTTTTLTSSPNPSAAGSPVTFTATVVPTPSQVGAPTGSVEFIQAASGANAQETLADVPLNSAGVATYTASPATAGSYPIVAEYTGQPNSYSPSTSNTIVQQVM